MKSHKIIFNPCENKENKYVDILVSGLENCGYEISGLDSFLSSFAHFRSIRLVHLNWFENLDDQDTGKMWLSYFRKLAVLQLIRLGKKKLVWTMHNRLSHEKKSGFLSRKLTQKLVRQADAIVIHSTTSRDILNSQFENIKAQIIHIPHPDFLDVYGPMLPDPTRDQNSKLQLLFLGAIKPYKNIEILIEAVSRFPHELCLTIAGSPNTLEYGRQIKEAAANAGNISLHLDFIPDNDLPKYFDSSDVVVLPYAIESSLNSGSAILAFSYGRTVICPRIGTIDDLAAEQEVFAYSYISESEHLEALGIQIQKAITIHSENPKKLLEKGKRMRELLLQKNKKEESVKSLARLYNDLLA
jgi:beta-1,4-mannosyltransferase